MKTGDPKTARLLMIVAIGAIGFVVIQLLPSKDAFQRGAAQAIESAGNDVVTEGLTSTVLKDSFSSPMLARSASRSEGEGEEMRPMSPGMTGLLPSPIFGNSGGSKEGPIEIPAGDETPPPAPEKEKRTVLLSGVVSVDEVVAFIAVDGKESRGCRVGELLAPGVKLVSVEGDTAVVSCEGRRIKLEMGQVIEL